MTDRVFIGSRAVADLLEMSLAAFRARREALEREFCFPQPLAWRGKPYSWRRSEVLAWLEADERRPMGPQDPAMLAVGRAAMLFEAQR